MAEVSNRIKTLNRFTAVIAAVLDLDFNSLRGFDTQDKLLASYVAKKVLQLDDGLLSTYYRINVDFMRRGWEDKQIALLVNDQLLIQCEQIKRLWLLLTDAGPEM